MSPTLHRDPTRRAVDSDATPDFPDPEGRFDGLPLKIAYYTGRDWMVLADLAYKAKRGTVATIRRGFLYDFGSIPRFFWRVLFPPTGDRGNPAGVAFTFHDWLYCHQEMDGVPITRAVADSIMLEILLYTGCSKWKSLAVYRGVRLGGWVPWRKHGKANRRSES